MIRKVKKELGEHTPTPLPEKVQEVIKEVIVDKKVTYESGKFTTLRLYNKPIFDSFKETVKRTKRTQAASLEEAILLFIKKYESKDL